MGGTHFPNSLWQRFWRRILMHTVEWEPGLRDFLPDFSSLERQVWISKIKRHITVRCPVLEFGPPPTILGLFGPPKKRVIFGTFNKRQICVFCVFTPNYLSNKLLMLYSCVLFLLFTIACIPTLFWYIYLKKGQRVSQRIDKEKVNQLFGPPNFLWSPARAG